MSLANGGVLLVTAPFGGQASRLSGVAWLIVLLVAVVCLALAWWRWSTAPRAWLTWSPDTDNSPQPGDAQDSAPFARADSPSGWWWSAEAGGDAVSLAVPEVAMGAERWLLLRLSPVGQPPRWVWVERRSLPERWLACRRALVAHAR